MRKEGKTACRAEGRNGLQDGVPELAVRLTLLSGHQAERLVGRANKKHQARLGDFRPPDQHGLCVDGRTRCVLQEIAHLTDPETGP